MRSRLPSYVLLAIACWLPIANCSRIAAGDARQAAEIPSGWRRTESGWEDAAGWRLDATPQSLPTSAAAVHPLVIASLELMISFGALLIGANSSRVARR